MKRLIISTIFTALFLHSTISLAGSNNASLECVATSKNGSGLKLSGSIPVDEAWFKLKLSNKHGEIVLSDPKEKIVVITAFKKSVFTMSVILADSRELILYAIPASVKAQGGDSREVKANFDAILLAAPRPGYVGEVNYNSIYDSIIRNVPMRCSFQHSV
jgi:hypothetical protein